MDLVRFWNADQERKLKSIDATKEASEKEGVGKIKQQADGYQAGSW